MVYYIQCSFIKFWKTYGKYLNYYYYYLNSMHYFMVLGGHSQIQCFWLAGCFNSLNIASMISISDYYFLLFRLFFINLLFNFLNYWGWGLC